MKKIANEHLVDVKWNISLVHKSFGGPVYINKQFFTALK